MEVELTITEFKNQLKAIGYAESTIESYSYGLDCFKRWLEGHDITNLRKITNEIILNYQEKVMSEPLCTESKALKIRPVKRLFEYLAKTHKLLINPSEGIVETSRKNRKIGTVLTTDEIKKLLAQPNLSLRIHVRDRAVMEVMYSSGMRLDELLKLTIYDVGLKEQTIYIRKGKGKKQRVVPIGKTAKKYLKEYLEKIRPYYAKKNPKERKIFLTNEGKPMSDGTVQGFMRKYGILAGIKKSVSPHTLRRTCATHMLQNGADIRYIQKLLGHKHLSTTQLYTKVMPVDIKKTHERTHPGVKIRNFKSEKRNKPKIQSTKSETKEGGEENED